MLDPSLPDRLIERGDRLSLDALEYIDELQTRLIDAQQKLIEANSRALASYEKALSL